MNDHDSAMITHIADEAWRRPCGSWNALAHHIQNMWPDVCGLPMGWDYILGCPVYEVAGGHLYAPIDTDGNQGPGFTARFCRGSSVTEHKAVLNEYTLQAFADAIATIIDDIHDVRTPSAADCLRALMGSRVSVWAFDDEHAFARIDQTDGSSEFLLAYFPDYDERTPGETQARDSWHGASMRDCMVMAGLIES